MTMLHPARPPRPARRASAPAARPAPAHAAAAPRHGLPPAQVPPSWGWKLPYAGRAAHVTAAPEYQATTAQICGLYPYVAGSGTPAVGTPVGRHQLWGEVVCLDPIAWLRAGLVTNPGEFVLGQPGIGKSTLVKRQITGAVATGTRAIILGDTKPDYTMLTEHLGGQVIRIGRGLDRINPLDAGPLGAALRRMSGPDAQALRWEVRSRRLSLLMALCALVRESRITNVEEVILGRAIDLLDERNQPGGQPTVTDVLKVIEEGPDTLRAAARAYSEAGYQDRSADLVFTLDLLATGSLAGVFDQPTSRPIDLDAPAVSVDISRVGAAGDKLLTAAMLCVWIVRVRDGRRGRRAGRTADRAPPLLPGGDGRAVAGAARCPRPGRVRRLPDAAEPGQGHGLDHDHPLTRRPGRPGRRRRTARKPAGLLSAARSPSWAGCRPANSPGCTRSRP